MTDTRAKWDVELGRQLYDQGLTYKVIGDWCGTTDQAVKHYGRVHWGPRPRRPRSLPPKTTKPRRAGYTNVEWDNFLGRNLWDKGLSRIAIAKECGTTPSAISGYAYRHWPKRPGDAARSAKHFPKLGPAAPAAPVVMRATPLPPGAVTLPPLPSLTFGDD